MESQGNEEVVGKKNEKVKEQLGRGQRKLNKLGEVHEFRCQ